MALASRLCSPHVPRWPRRPACALAQPRFLAPHHHLGAARGALVAAVALIALLLIAGGSIYVAIYPDAFGRDSRQPSPTNHRPPPPTPISIVSGDLALAEQAFREGDYAKAATLLEPLIQADPRAAEPRLLLAQVYCGQQRFPDAYVQIQAAIAATPKPTPAALEFDAGTIANRAGLIDQAAVHYAAAQAANPRESRYPLYLAMIQIKQGQDSAATASLVRAVNLAPDLAEGWGTLGELELRANTLGLALDHFRKARDLQPALARWRVGEARVLKRQGDAEAAATILTALDERDRFHPDTLALLAECFGFLSRPRAAAEAYAAAAITRAGSPDEGPFHRQAATWFDRAGDPEIAQKHARRADELGA